MSFFKQEHEGYWLPYHLGRQYLQQGLRCTGILAMLFIVTVATTFAQGGRMVFDTVVHDFGNIYEKDGRVTCTFLFTNTGTDSLRITNVETACGCTSSFFTKTVAPGKQGYIKVSYNPLGRVGAFNKSVHVSGNGFPAAVSLTINGLVLAGNNPNEPAQRLYTQYFIYNHKTVPVQDTGFVAFARYAKQLIAKSGKVNILIESSASHVPTKAFKTNELLAKARAAEARKALLTALRTAGANTAKVVFDKEIIQVQGPEYDEDYEENKEEFQRYQYIKLKAI